MCVVAFVTRIQMSKFFSVFYFAKLFPYFDFISNRDKIKNFDFYSSDIICASSGRSGSTMLTSFLELSFPESRVFKTHLLPLDSFPGKIIFIYSNPHKAAESVLHQFSLSKDFSFFHIRHMESSKIEWHLGLDDDSNNKVVQNILAADFIGYGEQIKEWVYNLEIADFSNATVMCIKYENLWDKNTLINLANFLGVDSVTLPEQKKRGAFFKDLSIQEVELINKYNIGTKNDPRYKAYDFAFDLWEAAPPFSFHILKKINN
jgi:hypothetical protein